MAEPADSNLQPDDGDIVLLPNFCKELATQIDPEFLVCQVRVPAPGMWVLMHGDRQVGPSELGATKLTFSLSRFTFFGKAVWMVTGADE